MKREDIYEGMSGIGPDLIEEAEKHVFAARRKPKLFRWAAAAAMFVLLCGIGVYGAAGGFTVRKLLLNGYEVRANISRIPMQEITGRVNEASEIIPEQYKTFPPYSNMFPGSFYKDVNSAEEAAAYIGYDREAWSGIEDNDLRITFDTNLRARDWDLDLRAGDFGELILPSECILMELKFTGGAPMWLARLLSENGVRYASFSKYGTYYKVLMGQAPTYGNYWQEVRHYA